MRTRSPSLDKDGGSNSSHQRDRAERPVNQKRSEPVRLQKSVGNQRMQRLLRLGSTQDLREREAAHAADQAMENELELARDALQAPVMRRQPPADAGDDASSDIANPFRHLGAGWPLPDPTRRFFEERFRQDVGGVRACDQWANAPARSLNAGADTDGRAGRRPASHDVTHVAQQRAQPASRVQGRALAAAIREVVQAPGESLDDATRQTMDMRFGFDFSRVRIHRDRPAHRTAGELEASAFTFGEHVAFAADRYAPGTPEGRELIAHELAHVVQQHGARPTGDIALAPVDGAPEIEARRAATAAVPGILTSQPLSVARAPLAGTRSPGTRLIGMQILLGPPPVLVLVTTTGTIGAPLQHADIQPGTYNVSVSVSNVPQKGGGRGVWRTLSIRPATLADAAAMGRAVVAFSAGTGAVDPQTLVGGGAVVVPLTVVGSATGPAKVASDTPATDVSPGATPGTPPKDEIKVEDEKAPADKPADKTPRLIEYGSKDGHGTSPEIDPNKLRIVDAYPSALEGPDVVPIGGKNIYSMNLSYSDVSTGLTATFEAANAVNYSWEMYEIKASRRDIEKTESAVDEFGQIPKEVREDTEAARQDRIRKQAEGKFQEAAAEKLSEELEGATLLVRYTGAVFNLIADAAGNRDYQREVLAPPRPGAFVIRVVAQPVDRPQQDGTILRRRPSIATHYVEVKDTRVIAEEAKQAMERGEKSLQERLDKAVDPAEKHQLDRQLGELQLFQHGTAEEYLDLRMAHLDEDIREVRKSGDPFKLRALIEQKESLTKQIELTRIRSAKIKGIKYRPQATLASEITGQTYPLLLMLSLEEPKKAGDPWNAHLYDVTSKSGRGDYAGSGPDPLQAAYYAAAALAAGNDYGRGQLAFSLPKQDPFNGQQQVFRNAPRGEALVRLRLQDLATIVGTVAIFVPGAGLAAAALGAGVAADRLYQRYTDNRLDWSDPETFNDVLAIVGGALAIAGTGVQTLGRLQIVRQGSKVYINIQKGIGVAGEAVDHVQLLAVNKEVFDQISEVNKLEASGQITGIEARHRRAQVLNMALQAAAPLVGKIAHARSAAGREAEPRRPEERARQVEEPPPAKRVVEDEGAGRTREQLNEQREQVKQTPSADEIANERKRIVQEEEQRLAGLAAEESLTPQTGAPVPSPERPIPRTSGEAESGQPGQHRVPEPVPEPQHISMGDGEIVSNLYRSEHAQKVYDNLISEQPHLEAGIWLDPTNGEMVVVQGAEGSVDTQTFLYADPEFADRPWRLVEHFHPGDEMLVRLPSGADFDVITHEQRASGRPEAISSKVRWVDPGTGEPKTTTFGYDPANRERPYFIEYVASDGSKQRRTFADPPWAPGSDFERFSRGFKAEPHQEVAPSADQEEVPTIPGRRLGSLGLSEAGAPPTAQDGSTEGPATPVVEKTVPIPRSPRDWQVVTVPAGPIPDLPPAGQRVVYEFPSGQRVWRLPDGRIAHESIVEPPPGRRLGYEHTFRTQRKAKIPGPPHEKAHTFGPILGAESPYGILYAPREVNQLLQRHGVEGYLNRLNRVIPDGTALRVHTETTQRQLTMRLQEIQYSVDVVEIDSGAIRPFLTFGIIVDGTFQNPRIAIDPVQFSNSRIAEYFRGLIPVPRRLYLGMRS